MSNIDSTGSRLPGSPMASHIGKQEPIGSDVAARTYEQTSSIPQLVAEVGMKADAVALVSGSQTMSYGVLNTRANQLAHLLRQLGIGPDIPVAIALERSTEALVAALAIMRAGGAYLPLDLSNPPERLALMLKDAHPPVVISDTRNAWLPLPNGARLIRLNVDEKAIACQSTEAPEPDIRPEQLAYLIYTSGSTGQPKGVQVTHGGLSNLANWHKRVFGITGCDRASQVASFGFDAAVWEVWPYLATGACVVVLDEIGQMSAESVRDWFVEQTITIGFVPTPVAEALLQLQWPASTALRFLLTGADTLHIYPPPGLPFTLVNNYGPTECTVVATSGIVPPGGNRDLLPSIGLPIDNIQIHLLDEQLRPVALGEVGEIYIGGEGLARGYLNRPDLTAEKFVASPFQPGTRLYKAGDLARYLPDGQIAFLGRVDDQIKIRGYRIEPDEIVTALNRHPAIKASAVAARDDSGGGKRLLAYLVLQPEENPMQSEMQSFLQAHLPDYMIPSGFVRIDELPLTRNGKVDRAALPAPAVDNLLPNAPPSTPQTAIEIQVAEIIGNLLGMREVGTDEDFFALGGHSLLAAQVITRVREQFDVELPLRTLFDGPTVGELAAEIEQLLIEKLQAMSPSELQRVLGSEPRADAA